MPAQQIEKLQVDVYGVIGDLTFESVVQVEIEGMDALKDSGKTVTFDLSSVNICSSAALALLLSWLRFSKKQGQALGFTQVPDQLQGLIKSAQLQDVIPLAT